MIYGTFTLHAAFLLLLLVGLELVLGIDNILIISLVVTPLPVLLRQRARVIGLLLALVFRLGFVVGAFWLTRLTVPLIFHFSARDLMLLLGGFFLLGKVLRELYLMVECKEEPPHLSSRRTGLSAVVTQVVLLDILFSIDSVITAVGLTTHLFTIITAVILSFTALLFYVGPVGEFIMRHPSLKVIALSFLVLIGVAFISEGLSYPFDKSPMYAALAFALVVNILQGRYLKNKNNT